MGYGAEKANGVGAFTIGKIKPLQRALLGSGAGAPGARATLSKLRRIGTAAGDGWMLVGDQLFEDWPVDCLGQPVLRDGRPSYELAAVQAALRLYGMHQQSQRSPMAIDGREGATGAYRGGFGQACRRIEPNLGRSSGIQRRLASVEEAVDFAGALYQIQALIPLLKGAGIPLDYYTLAADLYRLQFDGSREGVLARWANDYYLYRPADDGTQEAAVADR